MHIEFESVEELVKFNRLFKYIGDEAECKPTSQLKPKSNSKRVSKPEVDDDGYIKISGASALIGLAAGTLRFHIKNGNIPTIQSGGVTKVKLDELQEYLKYHNKESNINRLVSINSNRSKTDTESESVIQPVPFSKPVQLIPYVQFHDRVIAIIEKNRFNRDRDYKPLLKETYDKLSYDFGINWNKSRDDYNKETGKKLQSTLVIAWWLEQTGRLSPGSVEKALQYVIDKRLSESASCR